MEPGAPNGETNRIVIHRIFRHPANMVGPTPNVVWITNYTGIIEIRLSERDKFWLHKALPYIPRINSVMVCRENSVVKII